MKRGRILRDGTLLIGFGCIASSAFMVAVPLGLFVLGVPLMVLALYGAQKDDKHDAG